MIIKLEEKEHCFFSIRAKATCFCCSKRSSRKGTVLNSSSWTSVHPTTKVCMDRTGGGWVVCHNFTCYLLGFLSFVLLSDWLWQVNRPTHHSLLSPDCPTLANSYPTQLHEPFTPSREEEQTMSKVGGWQRRVHEKKRQNKQRTKEPEERQFGKRDKKELDKVVICWEDRRILSVVMRRGEIRIAVLSEKRQTLEKQERVRKKLEETRDSTEQQWE